MNNDRTQFTLFGFKGSGSAAIEAALEWAEQPYTLVRTASWAKGSALSRLAAINPLKQIPTLVLPDGTVLSESAAILIHLGLTCPAAGLLPKDAASRARCLRALVYIAANCYSAVGVTDFPQRWTTSTEEPAQEAVRQAARAQLHHHWGVFADLFAPGVEQAPEAAPFLSGLQTRGTDQPGAVDLLAAVVSKWSGTRAYLKAHRPGFLGLLERIEAHPRVAPVFSRHWP
ncbi:MAG TPA: glutathione S-transferase family protein [Burkholderiaceae bacterium]|nr:glutathione S-transferase family protein [Burkholderiaceae bacterium]